MLMTNQLSDDWNWSLAIAFLSLRHTLIATTVANN